MRTAEDIIREYLGKGKDKQYITLIARSRSPKRREEILQLLNDDRFVESVKNGMG